MEAQKDSIRKKMLRQRDCLDESVVMALSRTIGHALKKMPCYTNSKVVMLYASKGNEVHTSDLMEESIALRKRVLLPVIEPDGGLLLPSEIKEPEIELEPGMWGVSVPKPEYMRPVLNAEIDMVVVPGVVFDRTGGRIGFGKGYYDRFLSTLSKEVVFVGLCYGFQLLKEPLNLSHYDVRMDMVVTEDGSMRCGIA